MPRVLDDRSTATATASGGGRWRFIADGVMGGVSSGAIAAGVVDGRAALTLSGTVRLDHNGGFIQMALELPPSAPGDGPWQGLELDLYGDGRRYGVHLRTQGLAAPWQAWRAGVVAPPQWQTLRLRWSAFEPYRVGMPFDPARLARIGLVAIGEPGAVSVSLGRLALW